MTSNSQKLVEAFADGLQLQPAAIKDELTYNTIKEWDSIGHMAVVAAIEEKFGIMLDTDDIIDLSSVAKAKVILKKYEIDF